MSNKKQNYGWCFDKHGNKVKVSAPITSDFKEVKKQTTTQTSQIPANVGFDSMNSNEIENDVYEMSTR